MPVMIVQVEVSPNRNFISMTFIVVVSIRSVPQSVHVLNYW